MKNQKRTKPNPFFVTLIVAIVITSTLMVTNLIYTTTTSSSTTTSKTPTTNSVDDTPLELQSILHYATSSVVPQQSREEIRVTFNIIKALTPCNFLIFGLGHDSLMWSSFNPRGITLFLEEDPRRVQRFLAHAPTLHAYDIRYDTRLSHADSLLASYRLNPHCLPPDITLRGNTRCKLALSHLPDEVYNTEWDVIMADGPMGYFTGAPGRMAVIFSAAVMARARLQTGMTHVIVHDVDRRVERAYAKEFLCEKYLVKAEGKLWHFQIPSAVNASTGKQSFC